jgi:hypothetical protein
LAATRSFGLLQVVADEQIGRQPNPFPPDERHQEVRAQHQVEHHEHKQVQVGEKPVKTRIAVHVADGEQVNEKGDKGDEQDVQPGKLVELVRPLDGKVRQFSGAWSQGCRQRPARHPLKQRDHIWRGHFFGSAGFFGCSLRRLRIFSRFGRFLGASGLHILAGHPRHQLGFALPGRRLNLGIVRMVAERINGNRRADK